MPFYGKLFINKWINKIKTDAQKSTKNNEKLKRNKLKIICLLIS